MIKPIQSIKDIPFPKMDILDLLNLNQMGEKIKKEPDREYVKYGYSTAPVIHLVPTCDYRARVIKNGLVIMLHSVEETDPDAKDIELEFALTDLKLADQDFYVDLSVFLEKRFAEIQETYEAIILAVCNFNEIELPPIPVLEGIPTYYGIGEVVSYIEVETDDDDFITHLYYDSIRLEAKYWIRSDL